MSRTFLFQILFLSMVLSCSAETPKAPPASTGKPTEKERVTFVELGSVNCMPCRMMQPVMKAVAEQYAGKVKVVFHDVWTDAGRPFGKTYAIRAIPTQVFLDAEGKEFFRHEGFFPKEEIDKVLAPKLK
ncbi:MAG: thioredoxin family protein [Spirochaetes bacterium]|nr:thioredoxin family protein [Spirochaetota bacterium]